MIIRIRGIENKKVAVAYSMPPEVVIVTEKGTHNQQIFSGFDGLKDAFEAFESAFSDQVDFRTACSFFRPEVKARRV